MASASYNRLSIALHWIAAVSVIALFFTHEGPRDSLSYQFHVAGGAAIGILLIWRVVRRMRRGFATKPDQHWLFNLASTLVIWGLLIAILVVTLTGYLLPWTIGQPLDIAGLIAVPSPLPVMPALHEAMEEIHDISGHLIVPLVLLHTLGAIKHLVWDRDTVMHRMFRADSDGR